MRLSLRSRHVLAGVVSTTLLAVVAVRPELLGGRVRDAVGGLGDAEASWLWLAAAALAAMQAASGLAWNSALGACRGAPGRGQAMARYAVGSAANALAPAHVGSGLRIALFARITSGEAACWRVTGTAAAVSAVRCVWFAALVVVGAALGAVPAWPLLLLGAFAIVAALAAVVSRRIRSEARLAHLLDAFRELTASPGALARVAALTAAGMAAKLAAAACVAASLGVERPVVAALVIVPAVELAAVLPLTPGNIGVSSAAVALALASLGVAPDTALAAGIAFGALETLAALAAGAAGMLLLTAPRVRPMVRRAAVGTALGAVSWAIVLTAVPGV